MNLMQTQIERLSSWLTELDYDNIPSDVIEQAKYQALDCISSICSGSRSIVGKKIQDAIFQRGEIGDTPVFPSMQLRFDDTAPL